ncbi:hypothetical protein P4B35_21790 [Pontiellaceae bacterium B12227]|nr:hypothetical protein [Pontiellaceae bacterium B12227]
MKTIELLSGLVAVTLFSGCASMDGLNGPKGPRLTGSGYSNEYGSYAEVGVEFSSVGDFVAIVSPNRWRNPIKTGGSLSWVNPVAWSDDAGRTGRILAGQAIVVGGVAIAASAGGGDSGGSSGGPPPPDEPDPGPPPGGSF